MTETVTPTVTETATPTVTETPTATTPDVSQPPTSYAEALDHFAAASAANSVPDELNLFQTPSGNIYCSLGHDAIPAGCEINGGKTRGGSVCEGSMAKLVGRIELSDGVPRPICNPDTIRTEHPPVLAYGMVGRWTGGAVECVSERIGVTCLDTARGRDSF
ncbi:MAG: hypothetical protein ACR2FG_13715 [Marmoricola sp.]